MHKAIFLPGWRFARILEAARLSAVRMTALWWQTGVIYQIYPRSFQDTNGDGIGDLKGIERRLDYLAGIGVDAIWISPIYPSPMSDFGYDVADYCGVDPRFGTLADFDDLLAQAHACGLKVLLDFVPNHTSDQHPWFVESRASRENSKRDWYISRDPRSKWWAAQQLDQRFRGLGLAAGRGNGPRSRPRLPEGAGRPQLAQSGCAGGDVRRDALLVRSRRGRLPHRCAVAHGQGGGLPGQSA